MIRALSRYGSRLAGWAVACLIVAASWPASPRADDDPRVLERRVKAAFLYKFVAYIDWPAETFPDSSAAVHIGVMGDDVLARELERLSVGRTSGGRPVEVQRVEGPEPPPTVQVVFIGRSGEGRLRRVLQGLRDRPVAVITDSPGALSKGSMINFVLSDNRVRFEVNLRTAESHRLSLSSRLLAVAQAVITNGR